MPGEPFCACSNAAHILLTAHSLGMASCPVRGFHQGALKALLGLPADVVPELVIGLGYADDPPRPKAVKPVKEVISLDCYGNDSR